MHTANPTPRLSKHGKPVNCKAASIVRTLLVLAVSWISPPLGADMIKAGRFDFDLCEFGKADYPRQAERLIGDSFHRIAASIYKRATDNIVRQDSRCVGDHEIVDGAYRDHGICTQLDAEGDSWRMQYQTNTDLTGTWTAAEGSGKYQGMTARGEYRPVNNIPGLVPNGFKNCNHYSGTYQLR